MATFNGDENNNLLIGTDQADFLDGGLGVDTMQGGLGDDSYVVNDSSDVISGEQKSSLERVDIPQSPYYGLVSMSTDGTKIAYIESDNSGYNRRVIVVDVVTKQKEVVAVVDAYSQVRFSIDNQSLILDNQLIKNLVSGEEATITNTLTTFDNWQTDLVPFALTGSNVSLIKNTITGEVSRVGLDLNDLQPDHSNTNDVFLSLDGSKLIFQSFATNLVANDTNNSPDIFVKDVQTGEISLVSTSSTGEIASNPNTNVGSWNASISADGKKIAFLSGASNLVTDDANNLVDVFVKDLITGEVQQVASNAGANFVDFSLDGTKVLWGDGLNSLYVKDLNTGVITDAGAVANANTYAFGGSLVADGSKALTIMGAYASFASGFTVEYPTAIYVKDLTVSAESNVDTVTSSAYEYTLPENVENLWLSENATVGIGNSSDNQIMGNSAGNLLNGMAGEDYIHGHDGNDLLIGGSGNDTLVGGDGQNTLLGGMGNDILYGKTGDIYVFEDNMGNDTLAVWQQHGEKILDFSNLSFNDLTIKASFSGGFNYSLKLELINNGYQNIGSIILDGVQSFNLMEYANDFVFRFANGIDIIPNWTNVGQDIFGNYNQILSAVKGTAADDTLNIYNENAPMVLLGQQGNDVLILNNNTSGYLAGEQGNDTLSGGVGDDTLSGGEGDDVLAGHLGDDKYLCISLPVFS